MNKLFLVNSQWQGGGAISAMYGINEIENLYLKGESSILPEGFPYETVSVNDSEESLAMKNNILGYDAIKKQTLEAASLISKHDPDKIFTIGGSCEADISSILHLNEKYNRDLLVIWIDAHGDINAPHESYSHLFYGMPIRALLGECGDILSDVLKENMKPDQFMNLCGRSIDPPEKEYYQKHSIPMIEVDEIVQSYATDFTPVKKAMLRSGKKYVHIHLDFDSLDPAEFPNTPLPETSGLPVKYLLPLIDAIKETLIPVGFSFYEYTPIDKKHPLVEKLLDFGFEF